MVVVLGARCQLLVPVSLLLATCTALTPIIPTVAQMPETGGLLRDGSGQVVHSPLISLNGIPLDQEEKHRNYHQNVRVRLNRKKRSSPYSMEEDDTISKHCDRTAGVDANGTKIILCLNMRSFEDEDVVLRNYEDLTVIIYGTNTTRTRIPLRSFHLEYVVGWVIGEEFSSVSGYIIDSVFYGSIFIQSNIYYVDPLRNNLNQQDSEASLFDKSGMTAVSGKPHDSPLAPIQTLEEGRRKRDTETGQVRRDETTPKRKICSVALVADHVFHQEVGEGSYKKTVLQMLYHIKEANAVFITKDFNDDGVSECVGFQVEAITILENEQSYVNILLGEYSVPEDFLRRFSRYNFADYCLGILFTNRLFADLVLGLSWRGNPKPGGVGGTCQERARYREDNKTYSFNAMFVSFRSQQQTRIPLRMAVLNIVHELMHAFGAKHDPDVGERPECTPGDSETNGRFLMSKYSNNGRKHNHEVLSPCTKESVLNCMGSEDRTSCIKEIPLGYCGDGILDIGEECDCGDEFQCLVSKSCCNPPTGGPDNLPCTLSFREKCRIGNITSQNDLEENREQ